jgi:predicted MFS family arabinose efflux permease
VTQTVGYGTLYYSIAAFLSPVATDLHTSTATVTGAFTVAVLSGAALAVPVGRWLDRHGGRAIMTTGSVAGTVLMVVFSRIDTVAGLYLVWAGIGATGALVLYEPAFAVVVSWFDAARRPKALLAITVVAGFASSIYLPLTGLLIDRHGWRSAAIVLAVVHGAVTVPLHALVLRRPPHLQPHARDMHADLLRQAVGRALRDRGFWLLAAGFVAHTAALSTLTLHLIDFLKAAGHPATFAATVAGLLGVLSVTGRLIVTGLHRRVTPAAVAASVFALQAVAAAALPAVAASRVGAVAGVACFGLGFGVATIARPTLLTTRYGTAGYASIAATLVVPITLATATAPLAGAALHRTTGGYPAVFGAVATCCAVAATAVAASTRVPVPADLGGRPAQG